MEKIKDVQVERKYRLDIDPSTGALLGASGFIEITAKIVIPLPTTLANMPNVVPLSKSYLDMFDIIEVANGNAVFNVGPLSMGLFRQVQDPSTLDWTDTTTMIDHTDVFTLLESKLSYFTVRLSAFQPMPFDLAVGLSFDGTTWSYVPPPPVLP